MADDRKLDDAAATSELIAIFMKRKELFERLAEIGRDFDQATTPAAKRLNALAALEAIVEYLRAEDTPRDHMIIIQALKVPQALFGDLQNIQNGNEISFLEPERNDDQSRPPKSIIDDTGLARVSALISALKKKGRSLTDAAKRAAQEMEKRGLVLISPKSPSKDSKSDSGPALADQLINYRKRLISRNERPKDVKDVYDEAVRILTPLDADTAIKVTFDSL